MKITIEHYENEYYLKIPDDSAIDEVMDKIIALLVLVGYQKESIERDIKEIAESIDLNE